LSTSDIISALAALGSPELSTVISAGVSILAARSNGKHDEQPDELLDKKGAARFLNKSISWVNHNLAVLEPFRVHGFGAAPRFSRKGLEKYVSQRSGVNRQGLRP
jgi:hypothetical protein